MKIGAGMFSDGVGGSGEYLTISYRRNLAADDVEFEVQIATDLAAWTSLGTEFVSSVSNNDGTENVTYRSTAELASIPREFIRLLVTIRP